MVRRAPTLLMVALVAMVALGAQLAAAGTCMCSCCNSGPGCDPTSDANAAKGGVIENANSTMCTVATCIAAFPSSCPADPNAGVVQADYSSLPVWVIVVIAVGSALLVLTVVGILCCCCCWAAVEAVLCCCCPSRRRRSNVVVVQQQPGGGPPMKGAMPPPPYPAAYPPMGQTMVPPGGGPVPVNVAAGTQPYGAAPAAYSKGAFANNV